MNQKSFETGISPEALKNFHTEWGEFFESMFRSYDRAGKILRLHALTEHFLDRVLSMVLKKPHCVTRNNRFTYAHKLSVTESLGRIPEPITHALRALNDIRGDCAHSANPEISDKKIQKAVQQMTKTFKENLEDQDADGVEQDVLEAYVWTVFSEITLAEQALKKQLKHEPRTSPLP